MALLKIIICLVVILACFLQTSDIPDEDAKTLKNYSIAVMSVDLGSEWLKVAIVKPGVPMEIALNKESRRKTPFIVSMKGNEREFGDPALAVSVKQPEKAYIYLMSLLGKMYDSPAVEIYRKRFPHHTLLKDEKRGTVLFKGEEGQNHSVEELVAMMLNNSRHTAENFANHPMKDVVLTVPVFFNQAERKAIKNSANMVGLNVLQLMNDNTAVSLNYGIFRADKFNATVKNIMFFNMGATHATATIVGYSTTKVKDRGFVETVPQLVVKGVGFDTSIGGLEMDIRMRDHLVKAFKEKHNTLKDDITNNPRAMAKMLKEARRVRQVLSANTDHNAQVENVFKEKDFKLKVTRVQLEDMCKDIFERVNKPVKMALDAAAMTLDDIESVILMGGGTRIPKVQEILMETVKKTELGKNLNTDEAAALGAVYKAADLTAGFKVKRFLVKDLNLFPVDVHFERSNLSDEKSRVITRNLYHRLNPLPQKKVMTFNKKPSNFDFNISYGDLTFLSVELRNSMNLGSLKTVTLSGVDEAHKQNEKCAQKGIKAYFNLDESGLLQLEKVEAHFEKSPEQLKEEEESTLSKLGSKLSSFFGSGKKEDEEAESSDSNEDIQKKNEKDQKKQKKSSKKEDKNEEKGSKGEEKMKVKTKVDNTTNMNKTDEDKSANKTEEAKPTKPVTIKEPITFEIGELDISNIEKDVFNTSIKKLADLQARDLAKLETEKARNNLETHIFEFKDKLTNDEVQALSTENERDKIEKALSAASEWLDDEGFDADEKTLKKKLKGLKELSADLRLRIKETEERPKAIASLLQSFNMSAMFIDSMKNLPDAKEIYTEKDISDVEKLYQDTKQWLYSTWKSQNESDTAKKPVLLSKDILHHQGKLDREMMYLINKAKYYVPKPKPKPKSNTTSANSTKSKDKNTTTIDDASPTNETKDKVENSVEDKKNDEQPKSKTDEQPKSKTDEQPKSKTDEQPKSKTDEQPKSKMDEQSIKDERKDESTEEVRKPIVIGDEQVETTKATKNTDNHVPDDEL